MCTKPQKTEHGYGHCRVSTAFPTLAGFIHSYSGVKSPVM